MEILRNVELLQLHVDAGNIVQLALISYQYMPSELNSRPESAAT